MVYGTNLSWNISYAMKLWINYDNEGFHGVYYHFGNIVVWTIWMWVKITLMVEYRVAQLILFGMWEKRTISLGLSWFGINFSWLWVFCMVWIFGFITAWRKQTHPALERYALCLVLQCLLLFVLGGGFSILLIFLSFVLQVIGGFQFMSHGMFAILSTILFHG